MTQSKDKVFDIFKKFKALIENQSIIRSMVIKPDGGGECTSKTFESFFDDQGIQHEVITLYTPQYNGLAHRR